MKFRPIIKPSKFNLFFLNLRFTENLKIYTWVQTNLVLKLKKGWAISRINQSKRLYQNTTIGKGFPARFCAIKFNIPYCSSAEVVAALANWSGVFLVCGYKFRANWQWTDVNILGSREAVSLLSNIPLLIIVLYWVDFLLLPALEMWLEIPP